MNEDVFPIGKGGFPLRYQRLNRKSTGQTSIKHPQLYHERLNPNGYPSPPAHPAPMSSLFSTSKPRTGPSHWGNGPWGVRKSEGITGENWTYNHGSIFPTFFAQISLWTKRSKNWGEGMCQWYGNKRFCLLQGTINLSNMESKGVD